MSIISDRLLHLCYLRSDIMLMCHPLASRPLCSLPVIRLDYALVDVNAFSANKFTMSIIIFRCSSAGKGEGGRGGGAGVSRYGPAVAQHSGGVLSGDWNLTNVM